jgi:ribosome-binding factor A
VSGIGFRVEGETFPTLSTRAPMPEARYTTMSRRSERLQDQIRSDLSEMLQREVVDPRLSGGVMISITAVELTEDLRYARVYVSLLGSDEQVREAFAGIRHAAGYLRRGLAQRMTLRFVPELNFQLDSSVARGARVLELLKEISAESERKE